MGKRKLVWMLLYLICFRITRQGERVGFEGSFSNVQISFYIPFSSVNSHSNPLDLM